MVMINYIVMLLMSCIMMASGYRHRLALVVTQYVELGATQPLHSPDRSICISKRRLNQTIPQFAIGYEKRWHLHAWQTTAALPSLACESGDGGGGGGGGEAMEME